MKNSYEIRARKFAESIAPYFIGCKKVADYQWAVKVYNIEHKRAVRVYNGATRIALVTSDYVVKFDYDEDNVEDFGGCEKEEQMFDEAAENCAENAFCPIKYLFDKFYAMPRAICRHSYEGLSKFWASLSYDEEEFVREHIYDVHEGNVGYYNGRMVLVDYACNDI